MVGDYKPPCVTSVYLTDRSFPVRKWHRQIGTLWALQAFRDLTKVVRIATLVLCLKHSSLAHSKQNGLLKLLEICNGENKEI